MNLVNRWWMDFCVYGKVIESKRRESDGERERKDDESQVVVSEILIHDVKRERNRKKDKLTGAKEIELGRRRERERWRWLGGWREREKCWWRRGMNYCSVYPISGWLSLSLLQWINILRGKGRPFWDCNDLWQEWKKKVVGQMRMERIL